MTILCQRGDDTFLVEVENKYYLVDTFAITKSEVDSPDVIYRLGYCEVPKATEEQLKKINEILA